MASEAYAALEKAKSELRGVLERVWKNASEEAAGGALACPFCGGVKIVKKTTVASGVYTTRLACASALCGGAVRGEPRPTAEGAASSALSRWNGRRGGGGCERARKARL
jgi:hypothetical protein